MLIQDAFPDLTVADRELIKTGVCGDCWIEAHGHPSDEVIDKEGVSVLVRQISSDDRPLVEVQVDDDDHGRPNVTIRIDGTEVYAPGLYATVGCDIDTLMRLPGWKRHWPTEVAHKFLADHEAVLRDNALAAYRQVLEVLLGQWEGPDPRTL